MGQDTNYGTRYIALLRKRSEKGTYMLAAAFSVTFGISYTLWFYNSAVPTGAILPSVRALVRLRCSAFGATSLRWSHAMSCFSLVCFPLRQPGHAWRNRSKRPAHVLVHADARGGGERAVRRIARSRPHPHRDPLLFSLPPSTPPSAMHRMLRTR